MRSESEEVFGGGATVRPRTKKQQRRSRSSSALPTAPECDSRCRSATTGSKRVKSRNDKVLK